MDWQPIETAPKDGSNVFAVISGSHPETKTPFEPAVASFVDGEWRTVDHEEGDKYEPTHWTPLPPPPEQNK